VGFDLVEGASSVCPKCGTGWRPGSGWGSGTGIGNFFLTAGAVIGVLSCVFAVLKTLYGLMVLRQESLIISVSTESSALVVTVILLDGFVWFCVSAALVVVFRRVGQLH
jgi:hypothetical protein